jgi:NitT/TauT family transport system ATP-binding protein
MASTIEARNLKMAFRKGNAEYVVFKDLTFVVPAGAFVSVIGRSGVGKSTLLSILSAIVRPATGEVRVDGVELRTPKPDAVGMVFQEDRLLPWLSAADNVAFPLQLRGVDRRTRRSAAIEKLSIVGLADSADRFPRELSGGMRQRVAIARGLILDPGILLMDEPFGALDEQTREAMGDELLRIWSQTDKTVVFVTHSINEAVYLSDTVHVLNGVEHPNASTEVPITLGRPRRIEDLGSAEFGELRNKLRDLLEASSRAPN